ncbi:hypothetical protein Pst134EA_019143 [Puccinia striiformis f. sp. tritici]|uniref:hypothetical protein n=2 Tax=Puccinia striiformis f. sp. tritici TaxID=168172 RepID=UPI002008A513|nr:hypothetical protein Pst134EA_019143 [Puccinia striiformis f. sp. tritici]KAH9458991.1 hypothetical protein Pst134EA_019143 [Puccinia striiformis f. sp. tritici]KAI9613815.1 hypothetical protein H4Q26_009665 [Puccinia striiformis f. sp. tritici PST-130]
MAPNVETVQAALRRTLTLPGEIQTDEEFFQLDKSEITKQLLLLGLEISRQLIILPTEITALFHGPVSNGYPRMEHFARNHCFEPFRPLITALLVKEDKTNQEMFELINDSSSIPSATMSISSTSSLMNPSSTLALYDFLPALTQELEGLMYPNVPGLVEHFTQKHAVDPALLLDHESFINQKHEEIIRDTSQTIMLEWLTSFFTHCTTWLDTHSPNSRKSRTWWTDPIAFLQGGDAKRQMGGAIMSQHAKFYHPIPDILVPFELQTAESNASHAAISLGRHVYEVFLAQPTRSFVIGLTLCGTSMQLWQFDRSGAIGSESIDVKANKENLYKFFTLILSLLTCNKHDLGFDPSFLDIDGQACINIAESQKLQIETEGGIEEFVIDCLKFRAAGICGRGTTCWQAHISGDKSRKFLIKDSWQPEHRRQEGSMLCDMTKKNMPHVARYYHHQDVEVAGKKVDIQSYVRRGANFQSGQRTNTNQLDNSEVQNVFTNRVHRRLILRDVGEHISKVDSPVALLEALEGCIQGHRALFNAGILHKDISVNNLMFDNQTDDPNRKSFLIDLDVAVPYPTEHDEDDCVRAGTKVFMSINLLLQRNSHTYVDDLESFFWVLVWICALYPIHQRTTNDIALWNKQSLANLGILKIGYLSDSRLLTKHFTPHYKESHPLLNCVAKFAEIIRDPPLGEKELAASLYERILDVLREAQGKPKLSQS